MTQGSERDFHIFLIALAVAIFLAAIVVTLCSCAAAPPMPQWAEDRLIQYANGCDAGYPSACIALQAGFQASLAAEQQADYDYQARASRWQNAYLATQASRDAQFQSLNNQLLMETRP